MNKDEQVGIRNIISTMDSHKIRNLKNFQTSSKVVYSCEICGKYKTRDRGSFVRHQRHRHDVGTNSVHDCLFCKKILSTASQLEDHLRIHTMEKPYFCKVCSNSFAMKSNLECHLRIHAGAKPYPCKICGRPFRHCSNMKKHFQIHFKPKTKPRPRQYPKYKCNYCDVEFTRRDKLKIHERKYHTTKIVRVKKTGGIKLFPCPKCNKLFVKSRFERHFQSHGVGQLVCDVCGVYKTSREDTLKRHKRLVHKIGVESPNDCIFCKKKLSTPWEQEQHLRSHILESPYFCKICDEEFHSTSGRNVHILRKHSEEEKSWKCEFCPKEYFFKEQLQVHMRKHTMEKPHACQICKRRFARLGSLSTHIRVHTGEKPYTCKICNWATKQATDLRKHAKRHLKPDPKMSCKFCGKTFMKAHTLATHERGHTVEKPFTCKVCYRKFQMKCHLQSHFNQKHKTVSK